MVKMRLQLQEHIVGNLLLVVVSNKYKCLCPGVIRKRIAGSNEIKYIIYIASTL